MKDRTEEYLVREAQAGNDEAFGEIVRRYRDRIYGAALSVCRSLPDETEDVAQETFIAAHRHIKSFRGNSALGTWLYRIASNNCLMKLRKKAAQPIPLSSLEAIGQEPSAPDTPARSELADIVTRELHALPPEQKEAVMLADIMGLPLASAAKKAGIRLPAFKSRLHRARNFLKSRLKSAS